MKQEQLKRMIKNIVPWRLRYFIKVQEAKGSLKLPQKLKQHRSVVDYNNGLYQVLKELGITDMRDKTVCEMGPGEFLTHAFLEYQLGSKKEILLEIADFANVNSPVDTSHLILDKDYKITKNLPPLSQAETWKSYLKKINATYSINGLDGYKHIPDDSVDYIFSFAVLEHIRKNIFFKTLEETYRFMNRGGVFYHMVDFTDHFGDKKNHLRFPEKVWEDKTHYSMENYTNRIACSEICKILEETGFEILKVKNQLFNRIPIKRFHLDRQFSNISEKDLFIANSIIVGRKP